MSSKKSFLKYVDVSFQYASEGFGSTIKIENPSCLAEDFFDFQSG